MDLYHEERCLVRKQGQTGDNNGENISFWFANWTNRGPLHKDYPRLFALATNKQATIKERWDEENKSRIPNHRRPLNDWETNIWNSFNSIFDEPNKDKGKRKSIRILNKDNSFSIASIKHTLADDTTQN